MDWIEIISVTLLLCAAFGVVLFVSMMTSAIIQKLHEIEEKYGKTGGGRRK